MKTSFYLAWGLLSLSGCAQTPGCRAWEEHQTVYVQIDDPEGKFSLERKAQIHRAVLAWEEALNGYLIFEFTDEEAHIIIRPDTEANIKAEYDGHAAVTHYLPTEPGGAIIAPYDVGEWQFHGVMLHELGHALGLEHDSIDTVMYYSVNKSRADRVTCGDISQFCEINLCLPTAFPVCQDH